MDLNITKQEKQPLLSRTEVIAEVTFEGKTPSRYDLVQAISKQLKIKPELTIVKHIYTEFGSQKANIEAYSYEDEKVMKILEKKVREVKQPVKQEEPEAPTSATPVEGEEKTEEAKPVGSESKAEEQKEATAKEE